MLVTRSTRLPPLDPCIRQRFIFLEVRGAAIITRRDLFKGWAAPDIGGTIAEQRCPCTVYASTTSMWKLNNSRYRKAHSALFIPDNNELVRQREYLLSTTGFHLRVLSRAPRNPFSLSNHPPSLSFYRFHSLHSPSFRPSLRGASSPLLSLARVYPSRQPSSSRPSLSPDVCDCQCLPRTYYRDDVAALWRSARGGGGGGGAKNRGNLRSKLFASGPMRISAANYNYSRDSRAWKRLFDERIAWWGRGRKVEEVMGGLKRWSIAVKWKYRVFQFAREKFETRRKKYLYE